MRIFDHWLYKLGYSMSTHPNRATQPRRFFVRTISERPSYAYFDRNGDVAWTGNQQLAGRFERWEALRLRDNFLEQGAAVTTEVAA